MMRLHKITSKIQTSLETYCIYECSKISLYGTQYKCGQYIILPESNNSIFHFGKIIKLLACEKYCYLLYQETSNQYCQKTDLHFITEKKMYGIIPAHQLGDFHPIEGYAVGERKKTSLSLQNFVLEST